MAVNNRERHPKELLQLFLTEMWERFSFYLMLGLLPLFMMGLLPNPQIDQTIMRLSYTSPL